jgi:hypothetical protein
MLNGKHIPRCGYYECLVHCFPSERAITHVADRRQIAAVIPFWGYTRQIIFRLYFSTENFTNVRWFIFCVFSAQQKRDPVLIIMYIWNENIKFKLGTDSTYTHVYVRAFVTTFSNLQYSAEFGRFLWTGAFIWTWWA